MSPTKITTVIAGVLEDPSFSHVCYVAENLARMLPNFYIKKVWKSSLEWKPWMQEICKKYGWLHMESPLIWREIGATGTKVKYIGGAQQFWKLLQEHYNVEDGIKDTDIDALKLDALIAYKKESSIPSKANIRQRVITVVGAGASMCFQLISELITTKELYLSHGISINLLDTPNHYFKLRKLLQDFKFFGNSMQIVSIADNLSDGLHNCDILICLDYLKRQENEGTEEWLKRNYDYIKILSEQIDLYAPEEMKVIFCSMGPICFCANALHLLTTKLSKSNIVAVSAHYGLNIAHPFVNSLGFDMKEFGCPPVWGFIGINKFIDVGHMIQKYITQTKVNYEHLMNNQNKSSLLYAKRSSLRWFFYMTHDKNPYARYLCHKATVCTQNEDFQKCKAICDLLKLWYSDKDDIDDIISLGISSDGTFGIPEGIYFSQPVCLKAVNTKSRIWVPFNGFPLPFLPHSIFHNLICTAVNIIDNCIKSRIEYECDEFGETVENDI